MTHSPAFTTRSPGVAHPGDPMARDGRETGSRPPKHVCPGPARTVGASRRSTPSFRRPTGSRGVGTAQRRGRSPVAVAPIFELPALGPGNAGRYVRPVRPTHENSPELLALLSGGGCGRVGVLPRRRPAREHVTSNFARGRILPRRPGVAVVRRARRLGFGPLAPLAAAAGECVGSPVHPHPQPVDYPEVPVAVALTGSCGVANWLCLCPGPCTPSQAPTEPLESSTVCARSGQGSDPEAVVIRSIA